MKSKELLVASLVYAMAGCVSSGTKVTADQQSAFQAGTTTEAQVIAKLGPPNNVATLADGSKMDMYMHIAASANAASYIPIVGLFAGGAKSTSDTVTFTFDSQGILKSTTSNRSQSNVNTGLANQK
jgi:outer membrane protein assembly factor BamE (lipoprotein component of BamABCDE complex)